MVALLSVHCTFFIQREKVTLENVPLRKLSKHGSTIRLLHTMIISGHHEYPSLPLGEILLASEVDPFSSSSMNGDAFY